MKTRDEFQLREIEVCLATRLNHLVAGRYGKAAESCVPSCVPIWAEAHGKNKNIPVGIMPVDIGQDRCV